MTETTARTITPAMCVAASDAAMERGIILPASHAAPIIEAALAATPAALSASPAGLPIGYIPMPQGLNPDTAKMVCAFAASLAARLALSENKPRRGDYWQRTDWRDELVTELQRHVHKGDPRDVAAYCAFAWHHGWSIAPATAPSPASTQAEALTEALEETAKRIMWAIERNGPYNAGTADGRWHSMPKESRDRCLRAALAAARKEG